jgi:hypothetical protein
VIKAFGPDKKEEPAVQACDVASRRLRVGKARTNFCFAIKNDKCKQES